MKKILLFLTLSFFVGKTYSQISDEQIEKLVTVDGSIIQIQKLFGEALEQQKLQNPEIQDSYWESLTQSLKDEITNDLIQKIIPVYKNTFTKEEIDSLLNFYESNIGKSFVEKQPQLMERLSIPLMQWSQNIDLMITERIKQRDKKDIESDEIEEFENTFLNTHGVKIVNLDEFSIDRKFNIGNLLIDFGSTQGKSITKRLVIENKSKKPIFLSDGFPNFRDDIKINFPKDSIQPGSQGTVLIAIDENTAEGEIFSSLGIEISNGQRINLGYTYSAPRKEISYQVRDSILTAKKFRTKLSSSYEFKIKNSGKTTFSITRVTADKNIVYINYDKELISSGSEASIRVIYSKELMKLHKLNTLGLKIKVELKKDGSGFNSFSSPDKSLTLEIKE